MTTNKSLAIAFRMRVLNFWFSDQRWASHNNPPPVKQKPAHPSDLKRWFRSSKELDTDIRNNFEKDLDFLIKDQYRYPNDVDEPEHLLACLIALDQFPRNIFRNDARAFAYDEKARQLTKEIIDQKLDQRLPYVERGFVYLPLEHSENLDDQNRSVLYLNQLSNDAQADPEVEESLKNMLKLFAKSSEEHRQVVEQFGRFPHRNSVLNRPSTENENKYLQDGGSRFGQ